MQKRTPKRTLKKRKKNELDPRTKLWIVTGIALVLVFGFVIPMSAMQMDYPQPAALEEPYPDANCLKCHARVAAQRDFNNHFHYLLSKWQAMDPNNAAHCVDCHASHDTTNDAGAAFLNLSKTTEICQKCHSSIQE